MIEFGNVTFSKFTQLEKASEPKSVTEFWIVTNLRYLLYEKASDLIVFTVFGTVKDVAFC